MGKRPARAGFVLLLVATGFGVARLSSPAQAAGADDMLPAVLVEMKGLRAAMEQMASSGLQAQILAGRLQVQEHRVTSMIVRLDTVHDNLDTARREVDQTEESLHAFEKSDMSDVISQAEKETELSSMKAHLASAKARVDKLSVEDMQLSEDIAAEQQRWVAINQRLDEIERSLGRK